MSHPNHLSLGCAGSVLSKLEAAMVRTQDGPTGVSQEGEQEGSHQGMYQPEQRHTNQEDSSGTEAPLCLFPQVHHGQ